MNRSLQCRRAASHSAPSLDITVTSHDPYPDGYIKPGAASQLEELKNANFGEVGVPAPSSVPLAPALRCCVDRLVALAR